jgi:hypothetical protein
VIATRMSGQKRADSVESALQERKRRSTSPCDDDAAA